MHCFAKLISFLSLEGLLDFYFWTHTLITSLDTVDINYEILKTIRDD